MHPSELQPTAIPEGDMPGAAQPAARPEKPVREVKPFEMRRDGVVGAAARDVDRDLRAVVERIPQGTIQPDGEHTTPLVIAHVPQCVHPFGAIKDLESGGKFCTACDTPLMVVPLEALPDGHAPEPQPEPAPGEVIVTDTPAEEGAPEPTLDPTGAAPAPAAPPAIPPAPVSGRAKVLKDTIPPADAG